MNAVVKEVVMAPLRRPMFEVSSAALASVAAFIVANHAKLIAWFEQLNAIEPSDGSFEEFCAVQFDMERARLAEYERNLERRKRLFAQALAAGEIDLEEEYRCEERTKRFSNIDDATGIRIRGEI